MAEKETSKLKTDFTAAYVNADYYAIRIYPFVLTAEEKAQNHFADLCGYTKIDVAIAELYSTISASGQAVLHNEFASVNLADADKSLLEAAIQRISNAEKAFAELGATAEDFFSFKGYQVHLYGDPAFRATFTVEEFDKEGVTLKEIVISSASVGSDPILTTVYADGAFTDVVKEGEASSAIAGPYYGAALAETYLKAEWTFSASVTITYEGIDFTMDCDMTSAFGESVSIYELSTHESLKDLDTSKLVIDAVDAAQ